MKTVMVIVGTRPEAIKMAPVVQALSQSESLEPFVCSTAQHRELLDQVLGFFALRPQADLGVMRPGQDLYDVTVLCLERLRRLIHDIAPDCILVQGDTATAFTGALAGFYARIPVGHVEAGLRTWNWSAPFPEEGYRCLISQIADFHFAPTTQSARNLFDERVPEASVEITGNTGIDALLWAAKRAGVPRDLAALHRDKKLVLMTAHRRENFGEPIHAIFRAVRAVAAAHPEVQIVYPVHPNPNVREPAHALLGDVPNVSLIEPVGYSELVYLMRECRFLLTDSGGIQEEAPSLGKPVLVLRETTERPEAVEAGCARLVGADPVKIAGAFEELIDEESHTYLQMSHVANPFGDGHASERIVAHLEKYLVDEPRPLPEAA